jgi:hypothetical protein
MRFRLVILAAAFLVFLAPAFGQAEPSFSISSGETYYPGQKPKISVWSEGVGSLEFRVYRINDPVRFFAQLQDQHQFGGQAPRHGRERTWLEKFHALKHGIWVWLRDLVRAQFSAENRAQIRERQLQKHVQAVTKVETYAQVPLLNRQQLLSVWQWTPTEYKQRWESDSVVVPVTDPGVYLVEATNGNLRAYTVAMITEIAVITKTSPGLLLNYVVDRKSGVPVAGATVRVWINKEEIAQATTDANGLAAAQSQAEHPEDVSVLVSAGSRFAVNAIGAWNLGTGQEQRIESYGYTDRPVYRPGDSMHFKFILRSRMPAGFQVPQSREVRMEIDDPNGSAVLQRMYTLNDMGTFSGDFAIPADAKLGFWSMNIHIGDAQLGETTFYVEEYKKPEYQVRVMPQTPRVIQGQPIVATIEARYYFGEPVANAKVTWVVHQSTWWAPGRFMYEDEDSDYGEGDEAEAEGEYNYGGEQTEEQTGVLDADGKLQIKLPTRLSDKGHDIRYRIEARVTDEGNREIAGAGYAFATFAGYYLDAVPDSYVYKAGDTARITVHARDYDGHPVQTAFHARLSRCYWQDRDNSKELWSGDGRTDANGDATVPIPVTESGEFRLEITAQTAENRQITDSAFLWVPGTTPWWSGRRSEKLQIVTDKKEYKPGDTAHVAVIGADDDAHILVTVEGSYLYNRQVLTNRGSGFTMDFPIRTEFAPNVFVAATYIKDNKLYKGQKSVSVPPTEQALNVELKPSKPQFEPGESAVYTIRAHDAAGRPVQGEFSLGVVDEAIYAIRPEINGNILGAFYRKTWNQVTTETSLSYYFHGMAGKRTMQLASVRPAHSLAQLKPERLVEPKIRKAFPDTAYWVADIRTNANGEAQARFNFPDALTTWRTTVRGVTRDTKVGGAIDKVIVRKNLMVRLVTPRFFRQGDEMTVSTIVHNYLTSSKKARVSMDFTGLQIIQGGQQDITIASRAEVKVDWRVHVLNVQQARVLGKALTNEESDAMELTLPVEPFGVLLADKRSGAISGKGEQKTEVAFPTDAQAGSRMLSLSFTPSVAGTVFGALEFLTSYPYGCTEQTMSSFLPDVVVTKAMKELHANAHVDPVQLNKMTRTGLQRLYDYQHQEGGWGWWKTDDSNFFMTAYVLGGLAQARDAGYDVNPEVIKHGRTWLSQEFESSSGINPDQRAYAAYALALSGPPDTTKLESAWNLRGDLSPYGTAVLGLAMKLAGDRRADDLAVTLEKQAKTDGQQAWWESQRDEMLDFSTDATPEATAFAVKLLSATRPESPLLPQAALYLVTHRDEGYYWTSTKQTAMVIFGLIDYVRLGGELQPDFTAEVYVGKRQVLTRRFTAADVTAPPMVLQLPEAQLDPEKNTIRIKKTGGGRLYWSARAGYYSASRKVTNSGSLQLSITREYFRLSPFHQNDRILYRLDPLPAVLNVGDTVAVRLTVGGSDWNYMMVEDPIPPGAEAIQRDDLYELDSKPDWWNWWFTERELHDNRADFFQTWLGKGSHEYVYLLKIVNPGVFHISPARVEPMYQPNFLATTDAATVTVK